VQHHFWKYLKGSGEFKDAILDVYKRVDTAIGRICAQVPLDTTVFMMSDHGAGPASPYVFFVDEWLRENGLLRFDRSFSFRGVASKCVKWVLSASSQKLPSRFKDYLMGLFPDMRVRSQGYIRRALIDWSVTKVFSGEHPSTLRINLKERDAEGTVEPAEYDELRNRLIRSLESLRHPDTGERLIEKVCKREELYYGDYLDSAPDLIICPKDFSHQIKGGPFSNRFYERCISRKNPKDFFVNGVHRLNGIFVATGQGIRKGHVLEALNIFDLFTTILYSLGMEVPEGVDGRVAEEIFEEGYLSSHPIRLSTRPIKRWAEVSGIQINYEEEDSEKIEESLRGLGYID
jgi:predicted AlkP superfamily phosphohydrolase/phosphomutase